MNQTSSATVSDTAPARLAETLPGMRERADPRLVLADRVEQLYSQMWLGILMTFPLGAIAPCGVGEARLKELVLFWWFIVLLISGASAGLLYAYRQASDKALHPEQWLRW